MDTIALCTDVHAGKNRPFEHRDTARTRPSFPMLATRCAGLAVPPGAIMPWTSLDPLPCICSVAYACHPRGGYLPPDFLPQVPLPTGPHAKGGACTQSVLRSEAKRERRVCAPTAPYILRHVRFDSTEGAGGIEHNTAATDRARSEMAAPLGWTANRRTTPLLTRAGERTRQADYAAVAG